VKLLFSYSYISVDVESEKIKYSGDIKMKTLKKTGISLVIVIALFSMMLIQSAFGRQLDLNTKAALKTYIEKSGKEPGQYVIDKFNSKKVVILSEFSRLKHEVEFVKSLLPKLYSNGIYNLAIEYGNKEDQANMDKLLNNSNYDRNMAVQILRNFKQYGVWGYKEYMDIFKAAWDINNGSIPGNKKFRIVLMNSEKYQNGKTDIALRNKEMAEIIDKEILSTGAKALVFVSSPGTENCLSLMKSVSNPAEIKNHKISSILENKYKGSVSSIMFHAPWITVDRKSMKVTGLMKPLDGIIDEAVESLGNIPVGFDVEKSPLQNLSEKKSSHFEADNNYTFRCLCDGYIYLKPYSEYEYTEWIPDFIDENNFEFVKDYFKKINSDLPVETIDYATALCSAREWTILESAKMLQNKEYIKLDVPVIMAAK
jgi:hypothetical protein